MGIVSAGVASAQGLKCTVGTTLFTEYWAETPDCVPLRARNGDLAAQKEILLTLKDKYRWALVQGGDEVVEYFLAGTARGDKEIATLHAEILDALALQVVSRQEGLKEWRPEDDPFYATRPESLQRLREEQQILANLQGRFERMGGEGRAREIRAALLGDGQLELSKDVVADILDSDARDAATNERLLDLLLKATSLDDGAAETTLGTLYETGERWPADRAQAAAYYQAGWQKGSALATYHVGRNLLPGGLFVTDKARGYDLLRASNDKLWQAWQAAGDAGDFVEREKVTEALRLVHATLGPLAFEFAGAAAQNEDFAAAFPHYQVAAGAGVQEAMLALGYMYRTGRGAPAQSTDWEQTYFRNAANCSSATMATGPLQFRKDLCDQANAELAAIDQRIEDREQSAREATYAVLGLIGLALIGMGNAADYNGAYQAPNVGADAAMDTMMTLMWLGKW